MARRIKPDEPEALFNRELSWLAFARRVIALAEDADAPLLERFRFAGIAGTLHDEFFMKRISGLKRLLRRGASRTSPDGLSPGELFTRCRRELVAQNRALTKLLRDELLPAAAAEGLAIRDYRTLRARERKELRRVFRAQVLPVLIPLAVDSEHPFPFLSSGGLNLAVMLPPRDGGDGIRFVRIKVPDNLPRWVEVPSADGGYTPLEQLIAANLDLLYASARGRKVHVFRVTRGADGDPEHRSDGPAIGEVPGNIVDMVGRELKARRFAGIVRLEVDAAMPKKLRHWLAEQLELDADDVYPTRGFLRIHDVAALPPQGHERLLHPPHVPALHPRLVGLDTEDPAAIFDEIRRGDILLHHPYQCFESSALRFVRAAAEDPDVLAIRLTIYRTSRNSPFVEALADAARRGKQVAVLVEVTARFDEAPNIEWGRLLEREGAHVTYGVERLKTHVKATLVVRQEPGGLRRYAHLGTGNYHPGTARVYEDLGLLTADEETCDALADVFNSLTGLTAPEPHDRLLVAPETMRPRFVELIRAEVEHAKAGRHCGIDAKMNQLQDPEMIRELYRASAAGVPIRLNVRGLCCLRPGVRGLSENIRVFSVLGRFLEHSRIYRFANDGDPRYLIGSADWMRRNLSNRVETVAFVTDKSAQRTLDRVLDAYHRDNCTAWDCDADGSYERRRPRAGEPGRNVQETLVARAREAAEEAERRRRVAAPVSEAARPPARGSAAPPPPRTTGSGAATAGSAGSGAGSG